MKNVINTKIILDFIKNNNMSKAEFCKFCGVSYSNLKDVLNDNILDIDVEVVFKISKAIKVRLHEMFA